MLLRDYKEAEWHRWRRLDIHLNIKNYNFHVISWILLVGDKIREMASTL